MNPFDEYRRQVDYQTDSQSRLQAEASQNQNAMVAPQLKEQIAEAQAAVIAQTNPARALKIVLEGFKGNMQDEYGEFERIGDALMNEEGIARVASILIPFVNDPMRFGHIKETEVRSIALQVANDISEDIGLNWRNYGIKDPTTKDLIVDSLIALIFITLTRSEDGGEKNFLSRVILESVGANQGQKKKKESNWGKYFKL